MAETTYTLDKKRLAKFLKSVRQEIMNVQCGEARWRSGPPIHFEQDKAVPILSVLERFANSPTKKNYDGLIAQASQDLGKLTGDGFATWGQGLFTEVTAKGVPVVASKTFAASIKDGIYDCFKVAKVGLDQKQVDLMEQATTRMANAFQAEISKAVGEQLNELVARLKLKEAKAKPTPRSPKAKEKAAKALKAK